MIGQPFPATTFSIVKLREEVESAALLAETLGQAGGDDGGGFGVELADLVAAVVVLGVGEIGIAALGLAARRVSSRRRAGLQHPRATVKPAHEVVLRREVSPPAQIQPDSRGEVHRRPLMMIFALRHQHERAAAAAGSSSSTAGTGDGIEGENRRRSVGGGASVGAWDVVEGGVDVELMVLLGLGLCVVVRTVELVMSEDRGIVVGLVMMMMMVTVIMMMVMMGSTTEEMGVLVVEGGLSGGEVFEDVLSGRIGTRVLLRLLTRQHDRRRVPPFVV